MIKNRAQGAGRRAPGAVIADQIKYFSLRGLLPRNAYSQALPDVLIKEHLNNER